MAGVVERTPLIQSERHQHRRFAAERPNSAASIRQRRLPIFCGILGNRNKLFEQGASIRHADVSISGFSATLMGS
jgi:hypothetical protein